MMPYDASYQGGYSAPLEPLYMFDDLFERFRGEIEYAHSNGTTFQSNPLCFGRYVRDGSVTNEYAYFRLDVIADGTIRVKYVRTTSYPPTFPSGNITTCSKADFQSGTGNADNGKIFVFKFWGFDDSQAATLSPNGWTFIHFGKIGVYNGTWRSSDRFMHFDYSGNDVLPDQIPIATLSQNGCPPSDIAARMNQPEILGSYVSTYSSSPSYDSMYCSTTGEYDPDPTPPGPGPTPSSDPNYDPNVEPGDNPDPTPGPHNRTYDPVPIPGLPTVTAVGAGFTTLYRPSEAILRLLASELYSDNAIQIISNFFSDPYDMIAGLSIVPFTVPVNGRAKHRIGLFESDIAMDVVSNQFVTVNCGDILIEPYYNSFLDHSPYTRLILWLPYIGYQEIDPDEIMGQMLNITYHCDCLSGACTAFVNTGVVGETGPQIPRVIAQFSGNCSVQIPTAAASYDNLIASSINILTTAINAGVGQVGAAASMASMNSHDATQEDLDSVHANQAVHGGQSLIGCAGDVVRAMKPSVQRNGTPGSSAGYMGVQKPYLIKIVPRSSIPDDASFLAIKGYPSNKSGTLSEYSGFCIVEDIQLNNVPATISEINEIYELLKGGVIL
jgi:hypothetical protein